MTRIGRSNCAMNNNHCPPLGPFPHFSLCRNSSATPRCPSPVDPPPRRLVLARLHPLDHLRKVPAALGSGCRGPLQAQHLAADRGARAPGAQNAPHVTLGHEQWQSAAMLGQPCLVAEHKWDTMTRTEVLIARGYDAETIAGNGRHVEASPAPTGAYVGRLPVDTGEGLEAANGSEISQSGPEALSSPEVSPEAAEAAAGPPKILSRTLDGQTGRSCSECNGPLPAPHPGGTERLTCSPRCAQLRHNRLRHNRLRNPKESPEMKALRLATVPTEVEAETASALDLHTGCVDQNLRFPSTCWEQSRNAVVSGLSFENRRRCRSPFVLMA